MLLNRESLFCFLSFQPFFKGIELVGLVAIEKMDGLHFRHHFFLTDNHTFNRLCSYENASLKSWMSNALTRFLELFIVLSDRSNDQRRKISRKKNCHSSVFLNSSTQSRNSNFVTRLTSFRILENSLMCDSQRNT